MVSIIKFGEKTKLLTVTQEAVITTLFLAELRENQQVASSQVLFVSGQYFIHTLGIVFESYHRKLMRELEALGWLRVYRNNGTLYYCLSDSARSTKRGHFRDSRKCLILTETAPF